MSFGKGNGLFHNTLACRSTLEVIERQGDHKYKSAVSFWSDSGPPTLYTVHHSCSQTFCRIPQYKVHLPPRTHFVSLQSSTKPPSDSTARQMKKYLWVSSAQAFSPIVIHNVVPLKHGWSARSDEDRVLFSEKEYTIMQKQKQYPTLLSECRMLHGNLYIYGIDHQWGEDYGLHKVSKTWRLPQELGMVLLHMQFFYNSMTQSKVQCCPVVLPKKALSLI